MKPLFSILLFIFFTVSSFSQTVNEVWTDYIYNHNINSKLMIYGDATFRTGTSTIVGIRPSVRYKLNNTLQVMGGIGNNYSFSPILDSLQTIEIRPWQGAKAVWPRTNIFIIKHFFRIEEQLSSVVKEETDFSNSIRLRYQIGMQLDVWENNDGTHSIGMPIEYEIFHSLNRGPYFIERDRFILGLNYMLKSSLVIEFNYILQRSGQGYETLAPQKHIFRFRLRKTFNKRLLQPKKQEDEPLQM